MSKELPTELQLQLQKRVAAQKEEIQALKERNHYLSFQCLKMRLDFEVVMEDPTSKASEKILHKYRIKRSIREEAILALRN